MSDEHAIGNLLSFFTAFAEAFQRREIARDRGFFLPGAPARHFASLAPSRMVRKGGFVRGCSPGPGSYRFANFLPEKPDSPIRRETSYRETAVAVR